MALIRQAAGHKLSQNSGTVSSTPVAGARCLGVAVCNSRRSLIRISQLFVLLAAISRLYAYSVLTHEAIVDSAWKPTIERLLLKRFPSVTASQLQEAHAYAYGGCIIQDMGYYPFASRFFSDLVHYARSGDFVQALLKESQDINEYAFAVGALAHYAADNNGHPVVNRIVPMLYPKVRARYGEQATYENNPVAHLKTEFGFDVLQVARNRYAPEAYHDFIGFKVSKALPERAFQRTYGIELKHVFHSLDLALGIYRWSVSRVIPEMTKVAWEQNKEYLKNLTPTVTSDRFVYTLSRAHYEQEWGKVSRPGILARILALSLRLLPRIGPFRTVGFRPATPQTEQMFLMSYQRTLEKYQDLLGRLNLDRLNLENNNCDTGRFAHAGDYRLADAVYAKLLDQLVAHGLGDVTPELSRNIHTFFGEARASGAKSKIRAGKLRKLKMLRTTE